MKSRVVLRAVPREPRTIENEVHRTIAVPGFDPGPHALLERARHENCHRARLVTRWNQRVRPERIEKRGQVAALDDTRPKDVERLYLGLLVPTVALSDVVDHATTSGGLEGLHAVSCADRLPRNSTHGVV